MQRTRRFFLLIVVMAAAVLPGFVTVPGVGDARVALAQPGPACQVMQGGFDGFVIVEQGSRSAEEIANGFLRPAEALAFLQYWGFVLNEYWIYHTPGGSTTGSGTTSIEMSIHLFSTQGSASNALDYYAAERMAALRLGEIGFGQIGDESRMIGGYVDGGYETTLYIRYGNLLVRMTGVAPNGNPAPDVVYAAVTVLCEADDPYGGMISG